MQLFFIIGAEQTIEGCASLQYLQNNTLSMELNIQDKKYSNNAVKRKSFQDYWLLASPHIVYG